MADICNEWSACFFYKHLVLLPETKVDASHCHDRAAREITMITPFSCLLYNQLPVLLISCCPLGFSQLVRGGASSGHDPPPLSSSYPPNPTHIFRSRIMGRLRWAPASQDLPVTNWQVVGRDNWVLHAKFKTNTSDMDTRERRRNLLNFHFLSRRQEARWTRFAEVGGADRDRPLNLRSGAKILVAATAGLKGERMEKCSQSVITCCVNDKGDNWSKYSLDGLALHFRGFYLFSFFLACVSTFFC